jgi:hypothetical protein
VCDKTNLTLSKERKEIKYNDTFEVSDERAKEILKATYMNKPVAEIVEDNKATDVTDKSPRDKKNDRINALNDNEIITKNKEDSKAN